MSKKQVKDNSVGFKVLVVIVIAVSWVGGYTLTKSMFSTPTISSEALHTTSKNAFVSSCSSSAQKTVEGVLIPEEVNAYCGCAYDKLVEMYGADFAQDKTFFNRVLSTGYNTTETDKMIVCLSYISTGE